VVVLFGSGFHRELEEAKSLGAWLALPKPCSVHDLSACLMEILTAAAKRYSPSNYGPEETVSASECDRRLSMGSTVETLDTPKVAPDLILARRNA
jgi:hypothetical protein